MQCSFIADHDPLVSSIKWVIPAVKSRPENSETISSTTMWNFALVFLTYLLCMSLGVKRPSY